MNVRVRRDNSTNYPTGTIQLNQKVTEESNLETFYRTYRETEEQEHLFKQWTRTIIENPSEIPRVVSEYEQKFKNNARFFDLHGHSFQDFCLALTNTMTISEVRKLSLNHDHSKKRILRSRVFAISARDDIDWNGKKIENEEDRKVKKKVHVEHLKSLVLHDWYHPSTTILVNSLLPPSNAPIRVIREGTQEVVCKIVEELKDDSLLVAWVNFANAHNVCGTYSVDFGGSQEEEVATNCDGAALLGSQGDLTFSGFKSYMRGVWVSYNPGRHIPPGGNYFMKTRFITGPKQAECGMIAAAFADFRPYVPFFVPYSERGDYYSFMGFGGVSDQHALDERLTLDIEGVLKTSVAHGVHTLVTGASGCGAFLHDPYTEARLWRTALQKPEYQHLHVVFAIFDAEDSPNWKAFSSAFSET